MKWSHKSIGERVEEVGEESRQKTGIAEKKMKKEQGPGSYSYPILNDVASDGGATVSFRA